MSQCFERFGLPCFDLQVGADLQVVRSALEPDSLNRVTPFIHAVFATTGSGFDLQVAVPRPLTGERWRQKAQQVFAELHRHGVLIAGHVVNLEQHWTQRQETIGGSTLPSPSPQDSPLLCCAEPLTLDEERDCSAYTDDVEVSSP